MCHSDEPGAHKAGMGCLHVVDDDQSSGLRGQLLSEVFHPIQQLHGARGQLGQLLVAFLRRAMNSGTRITGQLRQPTISLYTWTITWDIKGCLCLFKHHSPKHTPDW